MLYIYFIVTQMTQIFLSRIERIKELLSSQATNGSEEENKGVIIDQELIELENCYRRKRRMAQRKQFSNSQILDKKKICENLWNLCDKELFCGRQFSNSLRSKNSYHCRKIL